MNRLHPITIFSYFMIIICVTAFMAHPVVLCISFLGVLLLMLVEGCMVQGKNIAIFTLLFVILSLINPIFYHNGRTVLFVANGNPITIEAIQYGMVIAGVILTVILWCRKLTEYMTTDKTLYLVGRVSKKGALLVAMVFRLIPQYKRQAAEIRHTQRCLGLFDQESLWGKLIAHLHVFSAMVTWAFEHSVDTADSMAARGYGTVRRSQYVNYRLSAEDYTLLATMAACLTATLVGIFTNRIDVAYYPSFHLNETNGAAVITYLSYGILVLLLPLYECKEKVKWNYLNSKK